MSDLRILTTPELASIPKPEYLLEPFIIEEGLTVLFGQSGTFKSFVALDWTLQTGLWQSVVYIAAEGAASLRNRIGAWQSNGPRGEIDSRWVPSPINLLDKRAVDEFAAALGGLAPQPPSLIVVDTLARCMAGGDENSAQDVGRVIGSIDQLRAAFGCAVVLIHHTGKHDGENERGSSALRGAADLSIRAKPAGVLQVRLECAKARDAEPFDPVVVRLEPVDGSLVAAASSTPAEALERSVREYMADHPDASQNEVERAVRGRTDDIRAAYKQVVRPVRPDHGRTPRTGAPRAAPLKGARAQSLHDPTLDPDEHLRLVEDGGW